MASTTATGPDISGTRTASSSISRSLSSALSSVSGTISRNITSSSSTISSSKSPVSTSPVATSVNDLVNADDGKAQGLEGISLETFLASLSVAAIVFAVEVLLFILLRKKLKRVYEPRTYLVPEKWVIPFKAVGLRCVADMPQTENPGPFVWLL